MKLKELSHGDRQEFERFINQRRHELSVYAFENIYVWKSIFDIRWASINNSLCIFFKDKFGCFLYLPPQGDALSEDTLEECFAVLDRFNKNKDISRIENAEEDNLHFYRKLGYECQEKFGEYLCRRSDLAALRGVKFKSKRALWNYFSKHYKFDYLPFQPEYRDECLKLYGSWMQERKAKNKDPIYQYMLLDSRSCLEILLKDYRYLSYVGRVVKIDGRIRAFTFGFKLNPDIFCIMYEIADLSIKGLSQFIFREFARELTDYKYLNIMDDSGLDNLKKTKLSYHPARLIPAYIIKRRNG